MVQHTRAREIVIPEHEECEIIVGRGMRADLTGTRLLVGNAALMEAKHRVHLRFSFFPLPGPQGSHLLAQVQG